MISSHLCISASGVDYNENNDPNCTVDMSCDEDGMHTMVFRSDFPKGKLVTLQH